MLTILTIDVARQIVTQEPICARRRWNKHRHEGLSAVKGEKMSDEDCDAIAEFIRSKGVTRCPTACVLPTQALVGPVDRAALEEHAVTRDRRLRARAASSWGKLFHPEPR